MIHWHHYKQYQVYRESVAILSVIFIVLGFNQAFAAGHLTGNLIENSLEVFDRAGAEEDLDTIRQYLADDFYYRMNSSPEEDGYVLNLTQYLGLLVKGSEVIDDYNYHRSPVEIRIARNGQTATCKSRLLEYLTYKQKHYSFMTVQIIKYTLLAGQPVITSIDASIEKIEQNSLDTL